MISKETVALVKDRTDIVAVVSESVPSLKRFGRAFKACCPFHKEKTPSFHVNPERGWFHCFGCGEKGSAIDFVMKRDGYTFPEAIRALAERAGIAVEEDRGATSSVDRAEAERQKKQKDDLYAVNQVAATFFEEQMRTHPQREYAEAELARRGLGPTDAAVQAFRIGYAPPGWDGLATYLRAQGISPMAGQDVGLLVPRSNGPGHYDRFRHRLMFAVIDPQGRVIAFSGRALKELPDDGEQKGEKKDPPPKYINSPESPIYTKGNALFGLYQARQSIRTQETAILVEGNFDVVSLHARGIDTAIAPLGTAFTPDQARLMKRYTPAVTILFDGDAAGKKATRLARVPCREAGLTARVATLPEGTDPDELARTKGPEALKDVLAEAKGFVDHLMGELLDESFSEADVGERMWRVNEVLKLIAEEQDPLARLMFKAYADKLSARLDLHGKRYMHDDLAHSEPLRALERATRQAFQVLAAAAPPNGPTPREARIKGGTPGANERKDIVLTLVEWPELLDDPAIQPALELLEGHSVQTVAALRKALVVGSGGEKAVDAAVFLDLVPPVIQAFASQRLAAPQHETLDTARGSLIDNATKLRKLILGREADDIARETYKATGDWQTETELAREALERVRRKQGVKDDGGR